MAQYTAWRGAIEIKLGGFPVPVNIALTPRTGSSKAPGFSLMSPIDGQTLKQQYVTPDGSWSGTIGEAGRGIDGTLLDPAVVKQIGESERSRLVEPDGFAPLDTIDFSLASTAYAVLPDDKTAGADRQVAVLWNGLRFGRLAYITRIVMRAGSLDRIVAIYADDHGLWAVTLPFAEEIKAIDLQMTLDGGPFQKDDKVGEMFATAIQNEYDVRDYDPADHPSEHRPRRQKLIEAALAGQPIPTPTVQPVAQAPDLMEALMHAMDAPTPAKTKAEKVTA